MLVFISWSGERSKHAAAALAQWLDRVIQAAEPWISTDVAKGSRWGAEIANRLERSRVGIVCLTPENLESRWILFEAGALSKTSGAYVCTFLVGLSPEDVEPPLSQFQHTTTEKADVKRLVFTINRAVESAGERSVPEPVLNETFEMFWPALEKSLRAVVDLPQVESVPPNDAVLKEMLVTLQRVERQLTQGETPSPATTNSALDSSLDELASSELISRSLKTSNPSVKDLLALQNVLKRFNE
jgi:hypothetical protein